MTPRISHITLLLRMRKIWNVITSVIGVWGVIAMIINFRSDWGRATEMFQPSEWIIINWTGVYFFCFIASLVTLVGINWDILMRLKADRDKKIEQEYKRLNPQFDTSFWSAHNIVEEHLVIRRGISRGEAKIESVKELRAAFYRGDLFVEAKDVKTYRRKKLNIEKDKIKDLNFDIDRFEHIFLIDSDGKKVFTELTVSRDQVISIWPRYDDEYRFRRMKSS